MDVSLARPILAQDEPEERRLARPGLSDEEDELSLGDVHAHVVESGADLGRIELGDAVEADHAAVSELSTLSGAITWRV